MRHENILQSARWCFLNFGFAKTSLDDIAKRSKISRTLLYKNFKDKEDIFAAVFAHWLTARQPAALTAARTAGRPDERLLEVCRLLALEPWTDMVGAPMAADFYDVCERLEPEISKAHRQVALECAATILGDVAAAEVFLLALDGLLVDQPSTTTLERRARLLVERFAAPPEKDRQDGQADKPKKLRKKERPKRGGRKKREK
jgi:AcrR family transcriptional regulator